MPPPHNTPVAPHPATPPPPTPGGRYVAESAGGRQDQKDHTLDEGDDTWVVSAFVTSHASWMFMPALCIQGRPHGPVPLPVAGATAFWLPAPRQRIISSTPTRNAQELRHAHIADVFTTLAGRFRDFQGRNKAAKYQIAGKGESRGAAHVGCWANEARAWPPKLRRHLPHSPANSLPPPHHLPHARPR